MHGVNKVRVVLVLVLLLVAVASVSAYTGTTSNGEIPVIIMMKSTPISPADMQGVTHTDTVLALRQSVERDQKSVINTLQSRGARDVTPLWIANAVAAKVTPELIKELRANPAVAKVEPDYIVYLDGKDPAKTTGIAHRSLFSKTEKEPLGQSLGDVVDTIQPAAIAWGVQWIEAPAVWQKGITGNGVNVSIVDTGINPDHPDLKGKTILWKDFVNNVSIPYDDNGHGSHVAGIVAGTGAGGFKTGVAPGVKLIVAKVFNSAGSANSSTIMAAFQWAVENGADVISYSGGSYALETQATDDFEYINFSSTRQVIMPVNSSYWGDTSLKPAYIFVDVYSPLMKNLSVSLFAPNGTRIQGTSADWLNPDPYREIIFKYSESRPLPAGDWTLNITQTDAYPNHWWYSGSGNNLNNKLTHSFDLTGVSTATLNFDTYYDTESGYDYGYVEISRDGGNTWTTLANYNGYASLNTQNINLNPYTGSNVTLRFRYTTDGSENGDGRYSWYIDNIAIPEIGFYDNVESGSGTWTANGWTILAAPIAYEYFISVGYPDDGTSARAQSVNTIAASGVIPVISAGNNGDWGLFTISTPGSAKDAITVGAIDNEMDYIAYYSSRGPVGYGTNQTIKPDVVAPGTHIQSASGSDSGYVYMSGTSMAAPHVTGTVALMLQANGSLTTSDVKRILQQSAVDLGVAGPDTTYGAGRISAYAAVANVTPLPVGKGRNYLFAGFAKTSDQIVEKPLILSAISWNKTPKAGTSIKFVVWNNSYTPTIDYEVFNDTLITDANGWANIALVPPVRDQWQTYTAKIKDQFNNTVKDQIYIQSPAMTPDTIRNPDTYSKYYEAKPNSTVQIRYSLLTPADEPYDQPLNVSLRSYYEPYSYPLNVSVIPYQGTIELTLNLSQYSFDDSGGDFAIELVNASGARASVGELYISDHSYSADINPYITTAQPGSQITYVFHAYEYYNGDTVPAPDQTYLMTIGWLNETQVNSLNAEYPDIAAKIRSPSIRNTPRAERVSDTIKDFRVSYTQIPVTTVNGVGVFSVTVPPGTYEGIVELDDEELYAQSLIIVDESPWMHHSAFIPNQTYALTLTGTWEGISDDVHKTIIPNNTAQITAYLTTTAGFPVKDGTVYIYTPYEIKTVVTDANGMASTMINVHPESNLPYTWYNNIQIFGVYTPFTSGSTTIYPPNWYMYPEFSTSLANHQLDINIRHFNRYNQPMNTTSILAVEAVDGTLGSRIIKGDGGGISVPYIGRGTYWIDDVYRITGFQYSYGWSSILIANTGLNLNPGIRPWYNPNQLIPIQVTIPGGSNAMVYIAEELYSGEDYYYYDNGYNIFGYVNASRCDANGNAVLYLKVPQSSEPVSWRIGYGTGTESYPNAKSGYFHVTGEQKPDLVPINDVQVIVSPGLTSFNVSIKNVGTAAAAENHMALIVDGVLVATNAVNALNVGEKQTFAFQRDLSAGRHNITAVADSNYEIEELSEYNNIEMIYAFAGNQPPVANFSANVTSGITPVVVQFTDFSTNSPTSWAWNFGDSETATARHPVHVYTTPGVYTVTLVATNDRGSDSEVKVQYITVTPAPSPTIFMPQNPILVRNSTVTVPVQMANLKDATGFSLNIVYNATIIQLNSVTINQSAIGGSSVTTNLTPGLARIVVTSTEGITIGSKIPVLNLSITAIGANAAMTPVSALDAQWSGTEFDTHPLTVVNGSIRIGIRGDFNQNGYVDIGDVTRVAYIVVNRAPVILPDADFNNNGIVDIGDAAKIAWYYVGKINDL